MGAQGSAEGAVADGPEHGEHLLRRRRPLDVVNRVEDKSTFRAEDVYPLPALPVDLVGGSEGKRVLGVDAAAPERDVASEFTLQAPGIHLGRGALHGVEDVKARRNEVRDQRIDVAT